MTVHLDALVAEIGSTITSVSAFRRLEDTSPEFLGQGSAATSVLEGDVRIGLENAIADLESTLGKKMEYDNFLASSSAAGGLRMSVHGLVKDMTARAAREAALGAGANVRMMTAGRMRKSDVDVLVDVDPNIILLAGGTDYGERDTALHNARLLVAAPLSCPVIYAGNIQNREEVIRLFESAGRRLYIVDNVYPGIDELDVEPARRIIQNVFEEHISHAPGMEHIREMVDGTIIPTPGAVMEGAKLLRSRLGDLCTLDVGGATTDVHTVCEDSEEYGRLLTSPEPLAKRTV
ncbi:MAG: glutamate mutase L, partial [Spirochaetaceae bacterium]|nr:glutamate mutase L [Spirochaetaceae bacterium]